MNYVYVLVSNAQDIFLEQLLLSITSLRNKTPDAAVIVLVDDITAGSLTGKRSEIYKLADEIKTVTPPGELNNVQRSRWLKTTVRQHISGDFLFIDCDTIISDNLSSICTINAEIASVFDQHSLLETHPLRQRFQSLDEKLGFSSFLSNKHFNSGVIYCRDTSRARDFYNEWHTLWQQSIAKDIQVDQPSFNQANINLNNVITELDGIWNCQIEFNGLQCLSKSKIIHYFSSNRNEKPYLLANPGVFQKIKETGYIPDEIKSYLEDARALFSPQLRLISDKRMLSIIDSSLFDYLLTRTFDKNNNSKVINNLSSFVSGIREIKGNIHKIFNRGNL